MIGFDWISRVQSHVVYRMGKKKGLTTEHGQKSIGRVLHRKRAKGRTERVVLKLSFKRI